MRSKLGSLSPRVYTDEGGIQGTKVKVVLETTPQGDSLLL